MNITPIIEKWKAEEKALENLACQHCEHGVWVGYNRYCRHDRPNAPEPVNLKRVTGGSCGPEALHLHIPSHHRALTWLEIAQAAQAEITHPKS